MTDAGDKSEVRKAFDFVAQDYDPFMERTGHLRAQREIIEKLTGDIGGRVLDVATGTGVIAAAVSGVSGTWVTAMDFSDKMLHKGVENAAAEGAMVSFVKGDIEAAPFQDGVFDVVVSCLGLPWFRARDTALREMARITGVKGRIILIEEEGAPGRSRIDSLDGARDVLVRFFSVIEKLETPVTLEEVEGELIGLGFRPARRVTARIDEDHGFIGMVFQR